MAGPHVTAALALALWPLLGALLLAVWAAGVAMGALVWWEERT